MTIIKNIVITGFMATGKTTIGKEIADLLRMTFLDTDQLIEKSASLKVEEIIRGRGENYFRELESIVIEKLPPDSGLVISSGGGAVLLEKNLRCLNRLGILFCLDAKIDELERRLGFDASRPLLDSADRRKKIESILWERQDLYRKIPRHIDTSDITPREAAIKIIKQYQRLIQNDGISNES